MLFSDAFPSRYGFKRKYIIKMDIKKYILTVIALVLIGEIARLVIPKGKTKKIAEVFIALVTVLSLSNPIIVYFKGNGADIGAKKINEEVLSFGGAVYYADEELFDRRVKRVLSDEKIPYSRFITEKENGEIKKVTIYLSDLVIEEDFEHIIDTEQRERIETLLGISKGAIEFVK